MTTPSCGRFLAELERALERREAERLAAHRHPARCAPCRARLQEELALERLLDEGGAAEPVAWAGELVPAQVSDERAEARLDALLGRVPEPTAPHELASRVLATLAPERARRLRGRALARRARLAAAAALLLLAAGAWLLPWRGSPPPVPGPALASGDGPEPELLEALDALEDWDVVTSDDLELLLAGLDPLDSTLLELGADTGG